MVADSCAGPGGRRRASRIRGCGGERRWRDFVPPLFLVLCLRLPVAAPFTVEMGGMTQTVFLNDNATIFCKVPGSLQLDPRIMGITWFRKPQMNEREDKLFEFYGYHQKAFRSGASVSPLGLRNGDASLQLPGVQLQEAGEYRCEVVVTPEKAQGTVFVEVVASPVGSLIQDPITVKDNEDIHILCELSGFYPKDINITWNKWVREDHQYLEFSEGITTDPVIKNEDGTFNVTSHLRLKHTLEHNRSVYQCAVRHSSLPTVKRLNITLNETASETKTQLWTTWLLTYLPWVPVLPGLILLFKRRLRIKIVTLGSAIKRFWDSRRRPQCPPAAEVIALHAVPPPAVENFLVGSTCDDL